MNLDQYEIPHSSFLSVEKDLSTIISSMLKNDRFVKLLYYTVPTALTEKDLSLKEKYDLLNKNIMIVPKITVNEKILNQVIISFNNFIMNQTNPQFRDNTITFDIICHMSQWNLGDYKLRPYKIAAEIDTMVNDKKFSGIGNLLFKGASEILLNDEFAGLSLMYESIHGGDDQYNMLNPKEQIDYNDFFNKVYNNE